jgi:hypothetical protein
MSINTKEIETLQKQKNDLLKQVDPLIAKKKKLYSDVDITTPKSSDEKKLDKEIADLFSEINDLVHKIVKLKKSQNEGRNIMKLKSVKEAIAVGKMVKIVDNPYWEAALGKKGPFKRKVKMIDGDNVFFTDGSNSSMKYVKEDTQLTNEAYDVELFWSGLSGDNRKIGRFLVSKNDYNKLEKYLKGHITFDLYDDGATGKVLSYKDVMNAIKNTKYGKIAFRESINEADLNWDVVQNAIINFLKVNTKILDKKVQAKDTEGVKGGLKSIISGLTNAQRNLKLESVNEAYDAETLPHLKKVSNEYYVDTPFIQYSNKFGNLAHVGFGDFSLKTSGGEVYFTRTSKQLPGFVGRTHTMSGDATTIKKLIASMSSKYELNENVKKSTYNRVARISNNGKLDIY